MKRIITLSFYLCVLFAIPMSAASRAGYLFVLDESSSAAAIFDADTLRLAATPTVGLNARAAFGVRGGESGLLKYYVLTNTSVEVLDAVFKPTGTISLDAEVSSEAHAAVAAPRQNRLLVAAGGSVIVINTKSDLIVAKLSPGFEANGLILAAGDDRAYITGAGNALRAVDMTSDSLLPLAASLPAVPHVIATPPNALNVLFAHDDSIYDFRSVLGPGQAARPQTGGLTAGAIEKMLVTDAGRYYLRRAGAIITGTVREGLAQTALRHPISGSPLGADVADFAVSADGSSLFLAFRGGLTLLRTDGEAGEVRASASLRSAPTSIMLVEPAPQQAAGSIAPVSEATFTLAAGMAFQLRVKAVNGAGQAQQGVPVFVSSYNAMTPIISCLSDATDAQGIALLDCTSGPVESARTVLIMVASGDGRTTTFSPRFEPPTATEGLAKISGDNTAVSNDGVFSLVVRATRNFLPQADVDLTIRTSIGAPRLRCPGTAKTDAAGFATIQCTTGTVIENTDATVTVSDTFGRMVVFAVTIDLNAIRSTGISKVSGDGQTVQQGQMFRPLVVAFRIAGVPQVDVQLRVQVSPLGVINCPAFIRTDEMGFASIPCTSQAVGAIRTATVSVNDETGIHNIISNPFRLSISTSGGSDSAMIEAVGSTSIRGPVGVELKDAVRVRAVSTGGLGVQGQKIYFTPGNEDLTFIPPIATTDESGNATANVIIGCGSGSRGDFGVGRMPGLLELEYDFVGSAGPLQQLKILQGNNQTGAPGQVLNSQALVVQALDFCNLSLSRLMVDWKVRPRDAATLRNTIGITDLGGRSSTLITLGQRGGPISIVASSGDKESKFTLNVNVNPQTLLLLSGNRQTVAPGQFAPLPLVVEVRATNGSTSTAVPVVFRVAEGEGTLETTNSQTDGLGIAFTRIRGGNTPARMVVEATALGQTVRFTLNDSTPLPMVPANGFTDGGSFRTGFVLGGTGSIFGTNLAKDLNGVIVADRAPFPLELGGVKVFIDGQQSPLIAVSNANGAGQINLQTPFNLTAPGTVNVMIDNNGAQATFNGISLLPVRPGIFQLFFAGFGTNVFAAALHLDFTVVTPQNPARPEEIIAVFLTGLGVTNPPVLTNTPGPRDPLAFVVADVKVFIDGQEQQHFGSVYAPDLITAYQTNFRLLGTVQAGNRTLTIEAGGQTSQPVLLPVAAAGN